MSSSADAVADVIAPPPRADAPRRAPDKSDGPSFEDHLKADDARPPREAAPTRPRDRVDNNKESDDVSADAAPAERPCDTTDDKGDEAAAAIQQQQQQQQPPPVTTPILLQLLGAQDDAPPGADGEVPAAKQADAAAPAPPPPQAPLPPDTGEQKTQSEHAAAPIAAAAPPEKPAKTQQPNAKPEAPQANAAPTAPATDAAAPAQPAQSPDPALAAAQVQLAAPQSAPAPAARSNDAQDGKIELDGARARGDVKPEAAPAPQPRDATPAPNAEPKMAAATQKALNSFKESLAAVSGEYQDAAPAASSSTNTTPSPALAQPAATSSAPGAEHVAATRTAPVASQVGQEIVRRFSNKSTSFELRLDPPELGRVDVRLDVSRDHRVNAVISADSPQALTELVRHARELEQSLQAAGLELGDNGLSFDLNQSRHGFGEARDDTNTSARTRAASSDTPEPAAAARPLGMESWRGVRVDVMA